VQETFYGQSSAGTELTVDAGSTVRHGRRETSARWQPDTWCRRAQVSWRPVPVDTYWWQAWNGCKKH